MEVAQRRGRTAAASGKRVGGVGSVSQVCDGVQPHSSPQPGTGEGGVAGSDSGAEEHVRQGAGG